MKKIITTGAVFLLVLFAGCTPNETEADVEEVNYIDMGMEELTSEEYEKAETYFEIAMDENPHNTKVENLKIQTSKFIEAENLFEENELEDAKEKANEVINIENGSKRLQTDGEQLIEEIDTILSVRGEETEEQEAQRAEEVSPTDETETVEAPDEEISTPIESVETVKEAAETHEEVDEGYTYEDFKGYYLHFTSPDQAHSDMIATISENFITVGWWMSEFELMEITGKSIDENILTIEYYQAADGHTVMEDTYGSLQLVLNEENGGKSLIFDTGIEFYEASLDEVENYEYTVKDYIIADM